MEKSYWFEQVESFVMVAGLGLCAGLVSETNETNFVKSFVIDAEIEIFLS